MAFGGRQTKVTSDLYLTEKERNRRKEFGMDLASGSCIGMRDLRDEILKLEISDHVHKIFDDDGDGSNFRMSPGNFSGAPEEDIDAWLKLYERACRVNNWKTDEEKGRFLSCFFTEAAAAWYNNCELSSKPEELASYAFMKKKLQKDFKSNSILNHLEIKLRSRKQGVNEDVTQYYYSMLNLCKRVDENMTDESILRHLVTGLRPALMMKVMMMDNSTLEKFYKNSLRAEETEMLCPKTSAELLSINKKLDALMANTFHTNSPTINALTEYGENSQVFYCTFCQRRRHFSDKSSSARNYTLRDCEAE